MDRESSKSVDEMLTASGVVEEAPLEPTRESDEGGVEVTPENKESPSEPQGNDELGSEPRPPTPDTAPITPDAEDRLNANELPVVVNQAVGGSRPKVNIIAQIQVPRDLDEAQIDVNKNDAGMSRKYST